MDAKKTRNKTTFLKNPRAFKFSFWNMSFPACIEFSRHLMFQILGNKLSQPIKANNYDEFLWRIFLDNFEAHANWNMQLDANFNLQYLFMERVHDFPSVMTCVFHWTHAVRDAHRPFQSALTPKFDESVGLQPRLTRSTLSGQEKGCAGQPIADSLWCSLFKT